MLPTIADFPHPGAIAWARGADRDEAHKVRILENDGRRDPLIAHVGLPPRDPALRRLGRPTHSMPASGNTRIPLADLFATREEALNPPKAKTPVHPEERPRRVAKGARKPRRTAH